jgi:hypothetical protein
MFFYPERSKQKPYTGEKREWNVAGYPVWHPALMLDLLTGVLIAPDWLDAVMEDDYTRFEVGRVGFGLCLILLCLMLLTLLLALDASAANWMQLVDLRGMTGLFLWSVGLGLVAAVAVIADQPVLFFISAMIAFFVGLVIGLLALLICEVWLRACYHWKRPWLGYLNVALLLFTHVTGLWLITSHAF